MLTQEVSSHELLKFRRYRKRPGKVRNMLLEEKKKQKNKNKTQVYR